MTRPVDLRVPILRQPAFECCEVGKMPVRTDGHLALRALVRVHRSEVNESGRCGEMGSRYRVEAGKVADRDLMRMRHSPRLQVSVRHRWRRKTASSAECVPATLRVSTINP